ncbi:MAG TPA: Yip1 family protein [Gammaproteobacteria bacterium]|nr:Yip1 family protein [Gammaproteobacteria bacterium]
MPKLSELGHDIIDQVEESVTGQTRAERILSNLDRAFKNLGRTFEKLTESTEGLALIGVGILIAMLVAIYLVSTVLHLASALISGAFSLVSTLASAGFSALSTIASVGYSALSTIATAGYSALSTIAAAGYSLLAQATSFALPLAMNLPWLYVGAAAVALGSSYFLYKKAFHGTNYKKSFKQELDKFLQRGKIGDAVVYADSHKFILSDDPNSAYLILGKRLAKRATNNELTQSAANELRTKARAEYGKVPKHSPAYTQAQFEMSTLCDTRDDKFIHTLKSGGIESEEVQKELVQCFNRFKK